MLPRKFSWRMTRWAKSTPLDWLFLNPGVIQTQLKRVGNKDQLSCPLAIFYFLPITFSLTWVDQNPKASLVSNTRHSYHPAWFVWTFFNTRVLVHVSPLMFSSLLTACCRMDTGRALLYHWTYEILVPVALHVRLTPLLTRICFCLASTTGFGGSKSKMQ